MNSQAGLLWGKARRRALFGAGGSGPGRGYRLRRQGWHSQGNLLSGGAGRSKARSHGQGRGHSGSAVLAYSPSWERMLEIALLGLAMPCMTSPICAPTTTSKFDPEPEYQAGLS